MQHDNMKPKAKIMVQIIHSTPGKQIENIPLDLEIISMIKTKPIFGLSKVYKTPLHCFKKERQEKSSRFAKTKICY